jgi:hypothetical protein
MIGRNRATIDMLLAWEEGLKHVRMREVKGRHMVLIG